MLKRIGRKIHTTVFPSVQDRELRRWHKDQGDERLMWDHDLNTGSRVIDAGGFMGQWSSDIYAIYQPHIVIFEPVPEYYQFIEWRFAKNDRVRVRAAALGAGDRQDHIDIRGAGSSLYTGTGGVTINVVDVGRVLTEPQFEAVDLLKLNVEGAEYEILERLIATRTIAKVSTLLVQFHCIAVAPQARKEAICSQLADTHRLAWRYDWVWEKWIRKEF